MPLRTAPSRAQVGPRVAATLLALGGILSFVSCGSRTGLFLPDPSGLPTEAFDAGDAAADAGTIPCVPGRFTFELALAQVMFVIDRSGSMAFSLDGREKVPRRDQRWFILQAALRTTLSPFDQQIAMGAKFFPEVVGTTDVTSPERACRTDTGAGIPPARGNADLIVNMFDLSEPRGGTPTSEAIRLAAQFLREQRGVARTLVVATDGAPNCNGNLDAKRCVCTSGDCMPGTNGRFSCLDDARTIATVRDVSEKEKIPVYVIGIGSTERPEFLRVLDDMAVAGGRPRPTAPRHYNVQSEDDLTSALATIRDSVTKCTYLTPSAPTNPDRITVEINGVVIPRDPTKTDGWDWVDKDYGELAFFGDACLEAQQTGPGGVSGVVSCEE